MTRAKIPTGARNIDTKTVEGFGEEWSAFDQGDLDPSERRRLFEQYFSLFPFDELPDDAEGFDLGCGSGRWAGLVAPRVGRLNCIDPSAKALEVCRRRLAGVANVDFHLADADAIPLTDASQDFGYALGVLHHIPDSARAMRDAVRKLKPGAPFLVYLYYSFDNRPAWFRAVWAVSDVARQAISRLPFPLRKAVTSGIAALVYWPLSRSAGLFEKAGADVGHFPLSAYRYRSFYSLRTDALDRFGTRLEQRFSKDEIRRMMAAADLTDIAFREGEPYWVACGRRAKAATGRDR
ncbi:class I SAM-dependent methyltransferase [Sphingomonas sp.]|uniref:class I SAM-dependent methyltransferase n=1 Tax=Sphingomonas sp. TaxID=28214 RepID=UPI00286B3A55|nr:class I SAM-dependent methyltransferase [Sphingomonas sp.]